MAVENLQVGASSDDATEQSGTMNLTGNFIGLATVGYWGGFRFTSVDIPNGSTVTEALFSIRPTSLAYDDVHLDVWCEDIDDAPTFTTATNNISNRTRTTATVALDQDSIGSGSFTSFDITGPVAEALGRGGWVALNALAVIVQATTGAGLRVRAYDGAAADAAKLDITYETADGAIMTTNRGYWGVP